MKLKEIARRARRIFEEFGWTWFHGVPLEEDFEEHIRDSIDVLKSEDADWVSSGRIMVINNRHSNEYIICVELGEIPKNEFERSDN